MKRIRRFSARLLFLILISLSVFAVFLSSLLYFGGEHLLDSWRESEQRELQDSVAAALLGLAESDPPATTATMTEVLAELPVLPSQLTVEDSSGNVVYSMRKGNGRNATRGPAQWIEVMKGDGTLAFRFSGEFPAFRESESNKRLLDSTRDLVLLGTAVAMMFSIFFAILYSRPLKKEAGALVQTLAAMAEGRRDMEVPACKVQEFDRIGHAATVLQESLKTEEALRRQWSEDVAHDLRTPLAVSRGQIEAMIDGIFSPEKSRLERLLAENGRIEALVEDLSLLTRIETPGFVPALETIVLGSFCADLRAEYAETVKERGFDLRTEECALPLHADPSLLGRALGNLVDNAVKYGKPGPIVVSFSGNGKEVDRIAVVNRGTIEPDALPRLFDRMYRAEQGRGKKGSGLGLSIVKAIVQAHGWTVSARSDPGEETVEIVMEQDRNDRRI
jgi:two-component system sensor histidine kinase BaeS